MRALADCSRPMAPAARTRALTVGSLVTTGLNKEKASKVTALLAALDDAPPRLRAQGLVPSTTPDIFLLIDTLLTGDKPVVLGAPGGYDTFHTKHLRHNIAAYAKSDLSVVQAPNQPPFSSNTETLEVCILVVPATTPPLAITAVYIPDGKNADPVRTAYAELTRIDLELADLGFARLYCGDFNCRGIADPSQVPSLPRRSCIPDVAPTHSAIALATFASHESEFAIVSGVGEAKNYTRVDMAGRGVSELDVHVASTTLVHSFLGTWTENGHGACAPVAPWWSSDHRPVFSAFKITFSNATDRPEPRPPLRLVDYSRATDAQLDAFAKSIDSQLRRLDVDMRQASSPRSAAAVAGGTSRICDVIIGAIHRAEDEYLGASTETRPGRKRRITVERWVRESPAVVAARAELARLAGRMHESTPQLWASFRDAKARCDARERQAHGHHLFSLIAECPDADAPRFRRLFQEFESLVLQRPSRLYGGGKEWNLIRDGEGFVVGAKDSERSLVRQYGARQQIDAARFDVEEHDRRLKAWKKIASHRLDPSTHNETIAATKLEQRDTRRLQLKTTTLLFR